MQRELKRRGAEGGDFAALCRREAWRVEREAKQCENPEKRAALTALVGELQKWADKEDADALAGAEPVPLVDRSGAER